MHCDKWILGTGQFKSAATVFIRYETVLMLVTVFNASNRVQLLG